jgi:hypothetical protein
MYRRFSFSKHYAAMYKMDGSMFARRGYLLSFSSQQTSKVIINITHDIHKNIIFAVEKNAKFSNRAKQAVLRCRITE